MKRLKIYAIDDDPAYLFLLKITLKNADTTALLATFSDGKKAIDFFTEHSNEPDSMPDVIFLDLNMPVMDGWDFLATFALLAPQLERNIPIYIASSSIAEKDISRANQNKLVAGFISKPVEENTLTEILNSIRK